MNWIGKPSVVNVWPVSRSVRNTTVYVVRSFARVLSVSNAYIPSVTHFDCSR